MADAAAMAQPEGDRRTWWSMGLRLAVTTLGWGLVAAGVVGIAAHFSGLVSSTFARLAAFTPLLIAAAAGGAVVFVAARRWRSAIVAAVVLVCGLATQVPLYLGTDEPVATDDVTVLQANILHGTADVDALADLVEDRDVDLLTVVELTPQAVDRIAATPISDLLPYSYVATRTEGGGAGIYSRYPLENPSRLDGFELSNLRAEVVLPGAGRVAVFALHPLPPWPEPAWRWNHELDMLAEILAAEPNPLIVGADMNSTFDHRQFRRLLSSDAGAPGMLDAAEHLGSGIVATYPANGRLPAMLALDRVLTRGAVPTSFSRVELPGSDHHGVVATVRVG